MDLELMELALQLNNELLNDPLIIRTKELEVIMNNDEEFIKSNNIYKHYLSLYEDAIKVNVDSSELQKQLYDAKLKLDLLECVVNYRNSYNQAKEYLNQIAKTVFKDITKNLKVNNWSI